MKAFLLSTIVFLAFSITCKAQWTTTSPPNIYFNTGNVGIGTASPAYPFDVTGVIHSLVSGGSNLVLSKNTGSSIEFNNGSGTQNALIEADNSTNRLEFWTNTATYTGLVERMRITSAGNVGIGTTSPGGKLDVNGAILLPGSTTNSMTRPAISSSRITGEISGYRGGNLLFDDGFLRLSAGGGTTAGVKTFIDLSGYSTIPDMLENIVFGTQGTERMRIMNSGNIGIGTTSPDQALTVNGTIHSKSVVVDANIFPDYVFNPTYNLPTLTEVKTYIDQNHHLPSVPSAAEVEKNGLNLGEMNKVLVQKVEELTLYLIEKDKKDKEKDARLNVQQIQIDQLKQQLNTLTKLITKN